MTTPRNQTSGVIRNMASIKRIYASLHLRTARTLEIVPINYYLFHSLCAFPPRLHMCLGKVNCRYTQNCPNWIKVRPCAYPRTPYSYSYSNRIHPLLSSAPRPQDLHPLRMVYNFPRFFPRLIDGVGGPVPLLALRSLSNVPGGPLDIFLVLNRPSKPFTHSSSGLPASQ